MLPLRGTGPFRRPRIPPRSHRYRELFGHPTMSKRAREVKLGRCTAAYICSVPVVFGKRDLNLRIWQLERCCRVYGRVLHERPEQDHEFTRNVVQHAITRVRAAHWHTHPRTLNERRQVCVSSLACVLDELSLESAMVIVCLGFLVVM